MKSTLKHGMKNHHHLETWENASWPSMKKQNGAVSLVGGLVRMD